MNLCILICVGVHILNHMPSIEHKIASEHAKCIVFTSPNFPFLLKTTNIRELMHQLKTEFCNVKRIDDYTAVFEIDNDATCYITKAFQEQAILNTKITVRGNVLLNSFWQALEQNRELYSIIIRSRDPQEEIWKRAKRYNYRIPTTFMPSYAKKIYDFSCHTLCGTQQAVVLDPCAGWGDRFLAATVSERVSRYIGFDPNRLLRAGYINIASACGIGVKEVCDDYILFANGSIIYSMQFEIGSPQIPDNYVDFVFTSPPFFNFEIYSDQNPTYANWIEEFYTPFFIESVRICKSDKYLAIYLGDTSSGTIDDWVSNIVETICPVKIMPKMGFVGVMSKKLRNIWLFKKHK
jgi:hypothetical protein